MKKVLLFAATLVILIAVNCWAMYTPVYEDTNINSGTYGKIEVFDSAKLNIYDGSIETLALQDTSVVRMYGGTIAFDIGISDLATLYLYGGQINRIYANNSTVHFYGQSITFQPTGGDTLIYGVWGNGTSFNFTAIRTGSYDEQFIFHQIPEPATMFLLLIGILGVRHSKC